MRFYISLCVQVGQVVLLQLMLFLTGDWPDVLGTLRYFLFFDTSCTFLSLQYAKAFILSVQQAMTQIPFRLQNVPAIAERI